MLNPNGDLFFCENSEPIGNVLDDAGRGAVLPRRQPGAPRARQGQGCPTCLSPCQMNVGAIKQVVPYAKFLVRAYQVKRDPARHLETLPTPRP